MALEGFELPFKVLPAMLQTGDLHFARVDLFVAGGLVLGVLVLFDAEVRRWTRQGLAGRNSRANRASVLGKLEPWEVLNVDAATEARRRDRRHCAMGARAHSRRSCGYGLRAVAMHDRGSMRESHCKRGWPSVTTRKGPGTMWLLRSRGARKCSSVKVQ